MMIATEIAKASLQCVSRSSALIFRLNQDSKNPRYISPPLLLAQFLLALIIGPYVALAAPLVYGNRVESAEAGVPSTDSPVVASIVGSHRYESSHSANRGKNSASVVQRTVIHPRLSKLPVPERVRNGRFIATLRNGEVAVLSLDLKLQRYVTDLVKRAQAPHIAVVAMNPSTGRILAYASKSNKIPNLLTHAGFPAASLFKVVTSAAALERTNLEPDSMIPFRGGTYELERWNFAPDPRRDRRIMTLTEALGRSCNPVFGRVALNYLSAPTLQLYANAFGFNESLGFDAPLELSEAAIPSDSFQRSRTGAGFGEVFISPIHAAALMSGIANRGVMPKPSVIESVYVPGTNRTVLVNAQMQKRMVNPGTASRLMTMMVSSTTTGTSRKDFMLKKRPVLGNVMVAAKTGTLRGKNPIGLNQWFIAAAPTSSPRIAIAIIAVDPRNSTARPARLARQILQNYL